MSNGKNPCNPGDCCTRTLVALLVVGEIISAVVLILWSVAIFAYYSGLGLPVSFHGFSILFNLALLFFCVMIGLGITCCSFSHEFWKKLLRVISISVVIISIFTIGYRMPIDSGSLVNSVEAALKEDVKNYYTNKGIQKSMDLLQGNFRCCGARGRQDYTDFGLPVPKSCGRLEVNIYGSDGEDHHANIDCVTVILFGELLSRNALAMNVAGWLLCGLFVFVGYSWGKSQASVQGNSAPWSVVTRPPAYQPQVDQCSVPNIYQSAPTSEVIGSKTQTSFRKV